MLRHWIATHCRAMLAMTTVSVIAVVVLFFAPFDGKGGGLFRQFGITASPSDAERSVTSGFTWGATISPTSGNVNATTLAANLTVAFGGREWLVIGAKDEDGKDRLTGLAASNGAGHSIAIEDARNDTLVLMAKTANQTGEDTDGEIYFADVITEAGLSYADSNLIAKMAALSSAPYLKSGEGEYIVPRNLLGGSGQLTISASGNGGMESWTQTLLNNTISFLTATAYLYNTQTHIITPIDWYEYNTLRLAASQDYTASPRFNPDRVYGENVSNQKYWSLSLAEASLLHEPIRAYGFMSDDRYVSQYWLRTPGRQTQGHGNVEAVGYSDGPYSIYTVGIIPNADDTYARPAFYFDSSKTLFTTNFVSPEGASGGKTTVYGSAGVAHAQSDTQTQKITVITEEGLSINKNKTTLTRQGYGLTYTLHYEGATPGKQLAAALIRDGKVVRTWLLDADSTISGVQESILVSGQGNTTIVLPSDTRGTDTLNIYVQETNDGYSLDFASEPVSFTSENLKIETQSLPTAVIGEEYSVEILTTGWSPIVFSITSGSLPPGFSLDAQSGVISGTPSDTEANYTFTIKATNDIGEEVSKTYTIQVRYLFDLETESLPPAIAGEAYEASIEAVGGGQISYAIIAGELPDGLSLNGDTGVISGVLTESATEQIFTIRVTRTADLVTTIERQFTISIYEFYDTLLLEADGYADKEYRVLKKKE